MFLTVVIPSKNRPDSLLKIVQDLEHQTDRRNDFEVIIVDGSTADIHTKIQEECQKSSLKIRILHEPEGKGLTGARNLGWKEGNGIWVAFIDDDVRVPPEWLQIARARIEANPDLCGIEGAVTTDNYSPLYHTTLNRKGDYSKRYEGFLTANIIYQKAILEKTGGFDERLPRSYPYREDADLAIRVLQLGRIPYCGDLQVHHPARPIPLWNVIKREMRHQSDAYFYKKHPKEYAQFFPVSNLLWMLLILGQLLGILGFFIDWQFLGINVFFGSFLVATGLFFIAGKGLRMGVYRWFGSYVRFFAYIKGCIKARKWMPFLRLILRSLRVIEEKTDNLKQPGREPILRICILCRSTPIHVPGGFEKYVFDLAYGLINRGHEVHVITKRLPKNRIKDEQEELNGIHLHYVGPRSSFFWYSFSFFIEMGKKLADLHRKHPFDIIHSNNLAAFAMFLVRPTDPWPPLITTAHGTNISEFKTHPRGLIKKIVRSIRFLPPVIPEYITFLRSEKIITIAPRAKMLVEQMNPKLKNKDLIISNGIDEQLFHPIDKKSRVVPKNITILFTGTVSLSKGIPTLYRAFKELSSKYPDLNLRLVGGGPILNEITLQVRSDHLSKRVRLDGYVDPSQMPEIYRQADIFVLPTESQEGFSFSILEALSTGLPAIVSSDCHVEHIFNKYRCGIVYPAGNTSKLVEAIEKLLSKPALRETLGQAGRQLILQRFTKSLMIEKVERVYQSVLKGKKREIP